MVNSTRKFRPYESRGLIADRQLTECLCPKCRTYHRMKLNWIGRGIPRKFCEKCKHRIGLKDLPDQVEQYSIHTNIKETII